MAQATTGQGTGNGAPTGDPPPTGEDGNEKNPALTPELEKIVNDRVNSAISTHMSRVRDSIEKKIGSKLDESLGPISEKLEALSQPPPDDGKGKEKESAELQQASARIAELERKNQEAEERNAAMQAKRQADEERTALTEALRTAGVDNPRMRAAVALLYGEDQRVGRSEEGDIVFRVQKPGYVHEATLEEGITEWLKTDEGKAFLPPRGAAGSGASGSQAGSRRRPTGKEERIAEARRTLLEGHGMRVVE